MRLGSVRRATLASLLHVRAGRRPQPTDITSIKLDPSAAVDAFYGLASYLFVHGKFDSAIEDLTFAINLNPPKDLLCRSLLTLGYSYEMAAMMNSNPAGNDLAIEDFSQVIRLCPDKKHQSQAYTHRAGVYRIFKHQYDRAIDDLTTELRINPRNAEALHNRALAEKELGRIVDAERDVEAARRIDPSISKE